MCSTRRIVVVLLAVAGIALLLRLVPIVHPPSGGVYLAGSKIKDERALGGFGDWPNLPKDLTGQNWGEAGAISLIAFPDERASYLNLRGFAVRLVNRTDKPVAFTACDSRLFLVQEALDRNGKWRPIEKMPQSWCGNSFHRVLLDRNQYWEFPATSYGGWFKTRLRFRLEQGNEGQQEIGRREDENPLICLPTPGGRVIYSNEFNGSVSLSQFVHETNHPE